MELRDCGVYLLAAGKGKRAGGPKAWQERGGKTLLERHVEFLQPRFDPEAIAISIKAEWRHRCMRLLPGANWVAVNSDATPLGALQTLLRAQPLDRWSFLYHVDMPVWEEALFSLLVLSIDTCQRAARVPTFHGRGGHPVLIAPHCHDALLALDPTRDRLDHWLRTADVERVELPFACIHENWNAPPGEQQ